MKTLVVCLAAISCNLPLIALADQQDAAAAQLTPSSQGEPQISPAYRVTTGASSSDAEIPAPDRPFLFVTDPSLPAPGHVIASLGMGNVSANTGEERPVGSGAVFPTVGAEIGILSRVSVYADAGYIYWQPGATDVSPVTLDAGAHILLTNPSSRQLRLALKVSYGRDFFGNSTAQLNAAFSWDHELVRVIAAGTVSHTFQSGADSADVEGTVGALWKLPLGFLVGVEGVVTDLEEIADAGAEGGSSAFAGPTVGWEWKHRFQTVAGLAYGAGPNYYHGLLFRAAASAQF